MCDSTKRKQRAFTCVLTYTHLVSHFHQFRDTQSRLKPSGFSCSFNLFTTRLQFFPLPNELPPVAGPQQDTPRALCSFSLSPGPLPSPPTTFHAPIAFEEQNNPPLLRRRPHCFCLRLSPAQAASKTPTPATTAAASSSSRTSCSGVKECVPLLRVN